MDQTANFIPTVCEAWINENPNGPAEDGNLNLGLQAQLRGRNHRLNHRLYTLDTGLWEDAVPKIENVPGAVGQAVQDASYLVTVPLVLPEVPILSKDPVVAYMTDPFTKPTALEAHAVIDIDPYLDTIIEMLSKHVSQVFEFLPYNKGSFDSVPTDQDSRLPWLRETFQQYIEWRSDKHREALIAAYGETRGNQVRCMEAYEISEYASSLDEKRKSQLFPG